MGVNFFQIEGEIYIEGGSNSIAEVRGLPGRERLNGQDDSDRWFYEV